MRAIVWYAMDVASVGIRPVLLGQTGHSRALQTHNHALRGLGATQQPRRATTGQDERAIWATQSWHQLVAAGSNGRTHFSAI